MLDVFGIEWSLLGKGCPYNNAVDEPANKMLKAELVYREAFGTTRELWVKLTDYVHWYNNFRMHSTLGYMTPVEFRKAGLVLPRIVQKDVANPYSSRGDWNMPWPGPIHKDSTHNAVRFGCYLGRHARMLHIFPLFPLNSQKLSPVRSGLPQFVPVCPNVTQSQKLPRIHGFKSGSRVSGRGRALSWVTVGHAKLRAAANGNMDAICQRWERQRSSATP